MQSQIVPFLIIFNLLFGIAKLVLTYMRSSQSNYIIVIILMGLAIFSSIVRISTKVCKIQISALFLLGTEHLIWEILNIIQTDQPNKIWVTLIFCAFYHSHWSDSNQSRVQYKVFLVVSVYSTIIFSIKTFYSQCEKSDYILSIIEAQFFWILLFAQILFESGQSDELIIEKSDKLLETHNTKDELFSTRSQNVKTIYSSPQGQIQKNNQFFKSDRLFSQNEKDLKLIPSSNIELDYHQFMQIYPSGFLVLVDFELILVNKNAEKILQSSVQQDIKSIMFNLEVAQIDLQKFCVVLDIRKPSIKGKKISHTHKLTNTFIMNRKQRNIFDQKIDLVSLNNFLKTIINSLQQQTINSKRDIQFIQNTKSTFITIDAQLTTEKAEIQYFKLNILIKIKEKEILKDHYQSLVIILFEDNTETVEKIQIYENREFQNRILNSFSHELRTPLNFSLITLDNFIQSNNVSTTIKEKCLVPLQNSNTILSYVLNDFVDLAEIENQNFMLNIKLFQVFDAARECLQLFQIALQKQKLRFQLSCQKEIESLEIRNDINRFKQVLVSLISNSVKFTNQGEIRIQIKQDNYTQNFIKISVYDTGIGMNQSLKNQILQSPQIFENPNYAKSSQINTKGIGIGMIMVQKLVKRIGDRQPIEIRSQINQGTKISFFLAREIRQRMLSSQDRLHLLPSQIQNINQSCDDLRKSISKQYLPQLKTLQNKIIPPQENIDPDFSQQLASFQPINLIIPKKNQLSLIENNRPKILIVDDNEFNVEALSNALQEIGWKSDQCYSGTAALKIVEENIEASNFLYDFIFMDIDMPILDGYETSKAVLKLVQQEYPKLNRVPTIITCSAFADSDSRIKAINSGMKYFISQPVDVDQLQSVLNLSS